MEWSSWLLSVLLFYLWYRWATARPKNFPPGPPRIPVIGALFRGSFPDPRLKQYGKVVGTFAGSHCFANIMDFDLAKELLSRDEWCGRGTNIITRWLRSSSGVNKGIIATEGQVWMEQRRFALKHLKDFGFGRSGLEGVIQDEAEELVSHLSQFDGQDFKMDHVFSIPAISILWSIVAGKRFQYSDPKAQSMMTLLNRLFRSKFFLEYMLPWYGIIRYIIPGLNYRKRIIDELRSMFRESIKDHRSTIDTQHPRDFIDVYLMEMSKGENPNFEQEQLEMVCLDLFKAGAETTSTTLSWTVLYLTIYPKVQEKCFQEVQEVVGEHRPSLSHHLPYCQATFQEVQRLAVVAPQTIPHRVTKEVELEGYTIPENAMSTFNLLQFMRDPNYWENPEEFDPERFLERDEQGNATIKRKERFVPYGMGKRVCMGESLAKNQLFIFFATLVKNFRFNPPQGKPCPDRNNFTDGFTIIPDVFYVQINKRK